MSYEVEHTVEDGIERIVYRPHNPVSDVPIVMQHGMWHGAWCWEPWQIQLAELGWESHAHSLPGHGQSPEQRPIRWCTLGYYLKFVAAEVARMPRKPILMGHSMGGALTQWYLKKVGDDLPAAVLVASWNSHEMQSASAQVAMRDPIGLLHMLTDLTASSFVLRNPQVAKTMLISEEAMITAEQLHLKLGRESALVLLQYNPLMWQPPRNIKTPLLWILPEADRAVLPSTQARSAAYYGADVIRVPGAAHNVMMEQKSVVPQLYGWLMRKIP
jgi:pimeloyl-ACP methyl ester carboxylesterase